METTSARPYFAIFAIVAIAAAAFILKSEYAGASDKPAAVASENPNRQLVKSPGGVDMVPEPIPDWFKRVGYEKLHFASQAEMDHTQTLMTSRGLPSPTADDIALIHKLHSSKDIILERIGFNLITKIQGTKDRKGFVPDVLAMYTPGDSNQEFNKVAVKWYKSGDKDLVESMAKSSKDPSMGPYIEHMVYNIQNPGK